MQVSRFSNHRAASNEVNLNTADAVVDALLMFARKHVSEFVFNSTEDIIVIDPARKKITTYLVPKLSPLSHDYIPELDKLTTGQWREIANMKRHDRGVVVLGRTSAYLFIGTGGMGDLTSEERPHLAGAMQSHVAWSICEQVFAPVPRGMDVYTNTSVSNSAKTALVVGDYSFDAMSDEYNWTSTIYFATNSVLESLAVTRVSDEESMEKGIFK